jgi:Fe2+ transport system protein FeoA
MESQIPLSIVKSGKTVNLMAIQSGRRLRKRLADLGLNIGMTVRVISNAYGGPIILAVKEDGRLALGRGMAEKIMVQEKE